jgi:TonB-linked SusC/RagA family outer membrane protein
MRKVLLLLVALLPALFAISQTKTITGKVIDESGIPVAAASVKAQGSDAGAAADPQGNFSITIPDTVNFIVVSSTGFATQTVGVQGLTTVTVTLVRESEQLSEVVVTALGIRRTRNELPYAAQRVTGEEVTRTRDPNLANALSGKVAGLEIRRNNNLGGSTNIVIRGVKSLTGNNQALFVVDGVPIDNSNSNTANQVTGRGGYDYGNAAQDINPDDIESVNVLKGAAATALYGSRASNGAIIITTKRASKDKGVGVTINTGMTWGLIDKSTFPTYQKQYGAGYGKYYESPDGFFLYRDVNGDGVEDLVTPTSEDASYGARFDPSLQVYQWDAFDPTSPNYLQARPWVAAANDPIEFFENAFSTSNSVFVDGGSDKGFFKIGYTKNTDKGILPKSSVNRDYVNFGAGYNITEKLTATTGLNFTNTKGLGRYGTGYDTKNLMTNFRQWWQTNVDIKELQNAYNRETRNVTWNWADPSDLVPIYWDNPYWTRYQNYQSDNRQRYFGNVALSYDVTSWLNLLGRVTLDSYDELQEERVAVGSLDPSQYSRFNRSFREYNYDFLINVNRDLTEKLSMRAILGSNIRRTKVSSMAASTNGGLVVPGLYSLSNSLNQIEAPLETESVLQVDGYFASLTFGYDDFLFLDVTGRRDESSSLPAENNVYYYPSASVSYVFSKHLRNNWLSYGKLRANYAEVGNTAPVHSVLDAFDKPTQFGSTALYSVPGTKNNPELRPERTKSLEAGLEMAFLKNRLGFDVTLYKQNTVDQILPVSISRSTGYNSKFVNAGNVENRGVELTMFGIPVRTEKFSWHINLNWTKNENLVKELFEIDNLQLGTFQGGVSLNAALGEPYGTIRGSNFVYNEQGRKVVGANGYYLITPTSNAIIGNVNPNWIGGINNLFRFGSLSLGFLIDVRNGGNVFSLDQYYGRATGLYPETAGLNDLGNPVRDPLADGGGVILDGVTEDGKENSTRVSASNYGLFGYVRNPAAGFVYDASYVKLREVTLSWAIPASFYRNSKTFKGIDLQLVGRNLWIIDKKVPYADPEDNMSSGNLQGYQGGSYPTTRTMGFNVRFRF